MPELFDDLYRLIKNAVVAKNYGSVSGLLSDLPSTHKPDFFEKEGANLLHMLAFQSSESLTTASTVYRIAALLIEHGAKPDAQNKQGNTPLHVAAQRGNALLAKLLVENAADINLQNKNGEKSADLLAVDEHLRNAIKTNSGWESAIEAQQKREYVEPVVLHVPKGMHI